MRVHSLYKDFFKFLERITPQADKWTHYNSIYYRPHQEFLETYFSHFPLIDFSNLMERVGMIKSADYSQLKSLISVCPLEPIIREAYKKCKSIVSPEEEPGVYLIIGFFSPDGFIMSFRGKPVICFGLERFKDFKLMRILFAHEYTHYLLNMSRGEVPADQKLKWLLLSEGIGTYFSQIAFPEYELSDHFLFRRDRLNWCQENESFLREAYCSKQYSSEQLIDIYKKGNTELNLPPRAGKYLGYIAIKKNLEQNKELEISSLLSSKMSLLKINL